MQYSQIKKAASRHREAAFFVIYGADPPGQDLLPFCPIRLSANPGHMESGTIREGSGLPCKKIPHPAPWAGPSFVLQPPAFLTGHIEQVFHVLPVIMLAEASAQFHAIAPGHRQRRRIIVSDARKDFRHTQVRQKRIPCTHGPILWHIRGASSSLPADSQLPGPARSGAWHRYAR